MNRISTRAFRWFTPLAGITLVSGIAAAKVTTETWQVKGVKNTADETKVQDALLRLPSVTDAKVHMQTVRVTFDDEKLQDSTIKDSVEKAGDYQLTNKVDHAKKMNSSSSEKSNKSSSSSNK